MLILAVPRITLTTIMYVSVALAIKKRWQCNMEKYLCFICNHALLFITFRFMEC
jgi:hypothetical protein